MCEKLLTFDNMVTAQISWWKTTSLQTIVVWLRLAAVTLREIGNGLQIIFI